MTNLIDGIDRCASRSSVKPLPLLKAPRGLLPASIHHSARGALHPRVCHGPARGALQARVGHGPARGPRYPALQHPARRLLPLQRPAGRLVPSELRARLPVAVRSAGVAVGQRIGRQPLGDVLIVGRGPALVGAVGRQPRREAGQAAQAQQKAYFGSVVNGLYLAKSGQEVW